jgi:poly-gamma-glutamate synthesis protein (capsule biosynthesis protein)
MSVRESAVRKKVKQHKKSKQKKIYMATALLIIISILLVGMLCIYLKWTNTPNKYDIKEDKTMVNGPIEKEIIISFAGDFTLGTDTKLSYESSLPAAFVNNGGNYSYFLRNVSEIFSKDDYTLVNLETTLTDSNVKSNKEGAIFFNFKGPKEYVNILTSASIDGVTIANNHIYDYGNQGINDTINTLKEKKIDICGE